MAQAAPPLIGTIVGGPGPSSSQTVLDVSSVSAAKKGYTTAQMIVVAVIVGAVLMIGVIAIGVDVYEDEEGGEYGGRGYGSSYNRKRPVKVVAMPPKAWWTPLAGYSMKGTDGNTYSNCGGRNQTSKLPNDPTRAWISVSAWDCTGCVGVKSAAFTSDGDKGSLKQSYGGEKMVLTAGNATTLPPQPPACDAKRCLTDESLLGTYLFNGKYNSYAKGGSWDKATRCRKTVYRRDAQGQNRPIKYTYPDAQCQCPDCWPWLGAQQAVSYSPLWLSRSALWHTCGARVSKKTIGTCKRVWTSLQCTEQVAMAGRPFLSRKSGRAIQATVVRGSDANRSGYCGVQPKARPQEQPPPAKKADTLDVSGLSAASRQTLAGSWARDGLAEHASIASFSRFALGLLSHGAPASLVERLHLAAIDEIRHARLRAATRRAGFLSQRRARAVRRSRLRSSPRRRCAKAASAKR